MDSKDVVGDAVRNMTADKVKPVLIPGGVYKFLVFTSRYLPWLYKILSRRKEKHFRETD